MRIPTAHDFCVISARTQNVRDSPQTKLDSEINARFLLNEHGDYAVHLRTKINDNKMIFEFQKQDN